MSTNKKTKFNHDGSEKAVSDAVRQFAADQTLMRINKESTLILMNEDNGNAFSGARYLEFLGYEGNRTPKKQVVIANGWVLLDLAYYVIKHSNDYRGKATVSGEELAALISVVTARFQRWEHEELERIKLNSDINVDLMFYLWGFSGEQFKFQKLKNCFDTASRELYILLECGKRIGISTDVAGLILSETGLEWNEVLAFIFLAWFQSTQDAFLLGVKNKINWDEQFTYDKYCSLLKRYTTTYDEVRKDSYHLGRQQLYTKPYIQTQKGAIISVNTYLNLFLYEHCLLWIVRDYYNRSQNQQFTSEFGLCFEEYFREILSRYLNEADYQRVPEAPAKRADWRITLGNIKILVEQKSSFLSLLVKQQEADIEKYKEYCTKYIFKALKQLENTEVFYNDGKYIKIILLYEEYLKSEMLDDIFRLSGCEVQDDGYYWLITIPEMEMLLSFYHSDPHGFYGLIEEKIELETKKSKDGRSIEQLLNSRSILDNTHLEREEFLKYRNVANDTLRSHLGHDR